MNNSTLFWRLAWKEYRMLRGFWISLALATVGLQLLAVVTVTLTNESTKDLPAGLFGFGLAMVAFYALGCGATLFAVEREEETFDLLRSLPVTGAQVMRAKMSVAVTSVIALWAFVAVESPLVAGMQLPDLQSLAYLWATFGLAAVEALAWGTFFSLVLRRPISAVFAAAATGIVSVGLIVWCVVEVQSQIITGMEDMPVLILYRALAIFTIGATAVWLARHWFDDSLRVSLASLSAGRARHEQQAHGIALGSLLWQQWRQSRLTMIVMTAAGVALVIWIFSVKTWDSSERRMPIITMAVAIVTVLFAALAGANVFQSDQSNHSFRFLAERGVRPATVWCTRHLIWLAPVALWATVTVFLFLLSIDERDRNSLAEELTKDNLNIVANVGQALRIIAGLGGVVLAIAYSAGQFCSMFLRKGVVSSFFALLLTGVLFYWAEIMDNLGISWVWSVAPIPIVLMVATWLRTPHWLLERTDWVARWQAVLSIVAPAAVLAIAVIAFRVYQIPNAQIDFADAEFSRSPTEDERTTAQMYVEAEGMIKFPPTDENGINKAWWKLALADNQAAIQLALAATARPTCSFYDHRVLESGERAADFVPVQRLGRLLVKSAQALEEEGKLDGAWDRYFAALTLSRRMRPSEADADRLEAEVEELLPYWAAKPGQTEEKIQLTIDELRKFYAKLPPPTDAIKADYVTASRLLELDSDQMPNATGTTPHELRMLRISTALVPWEMARSRRLLKLVAALDIQAIEQVQSATANGTPYTNAWSSIIADSEPLNLGATTLFYQFGMPLPAGVADRVLLMENRRRATLVLLALEAWKAKHGKLPKTLDELAGTYLDNVPLDPYSGKPYRYMTWTSAGGGDYGFTDGASYPDVPPGEVVYHYLVSEQPTAEPQSRQSNGAPVYGPFGGMGASPPETPMEAPHGAWLHGRRAFGIP